MGLAGAGRGEQTTQHHNEDEDVQHLRGRGREGRALVTPLTPSEAVTWVFSLLLLASLFPNSFSEGRCQSTKPCQSSAAVRVKTLNLPTP